MTGIPILIPTTGAIRCANKACEYYTPKGCTLFAGEAWRRCRKASSTNRKRKTGGKKHG